MDLLVVHEFDFQDKDANIIAIVDHPDNVPALLEKYYGGFKELSHQTIQDSNMEWAKTLEIKGMEEDPYRVRITLEWFKLNEI